MCREGAWAELAAEVTSGGDIRSRGAQKILKILSIGSVRQSLTTMGSALQIFVNFWACLLHRRPFFCIMNFSLGLLSGVQLQQKYP